MPLRETLTQLPILRRIPGLYGGRSGHRVPERGFWTCYSKREKFHDGPLCEALITLLSGAGARSILDMGCGDATYMRHMREHFELVLGFDGNPYTQDMSAGRAGILDLSKPIDLDYRFDWVLSLEVAEHIPAEYEEIYLQNLARHCGRGIVLSWARPGQIGRGHVNCRPQRYVVRRLADLGYACDWASTRTLRSAARLRWFRENLLVFNKGASQDAL